MRNIVLLAITLPMLALAGCDRTDEKDDKPAIAPGCAEAVCSEVDVDVAFGCYDVTLDLEFSMSARISGVVDHTSCAVEKVAGGTDIGVIVGPVDPDSDETSAIAFRLRDYTGPGTYPLINLAEENDHLGFRVTGNNTIPEGIGNTSNTVGTMSCFTPLCEAIVAPGSELVPDDPAGAREFRLSVEIRCPAGGQLTDFHGCSDPKGQSCTLSAAPTLAVEVVCIH